MMHYKRSFIALLSCGLIPFTAFADGQSVPINYDNISFFEEPLAVELGPATFNANIVVDQAVRYSSARKKDSYNTNVIGQFNVETQLPNSVQVGVKYIANYNRLRENDDNRYSDDIAFFASDEWGTIAGGNVTGSVRENTRRNKGFGNADLAHDDFIGGLDDTGAFYSVRHNSYITSLTADQEGRAEAGISFQRPIGKSVYFASARVRKGDTSEESANAIDADTYGGAVVAKYTYASFLVDGQIGYERLNHNNSSENDTHIFGSIGTQYKYGAYRFSAEAGLGDIDGEDRRSIALGSRVDIARGASVNLGVNYIHENDDDDTMSSASIRYEF
jgi:hypothetical protein